MNWNEASLSLLKEYFYDAVGYYPNDSMTRDEIISVIKKYW